MDNSFEKLINRVLDGRYKIENVVGIGGMAYVLKAVDLQNDNAPVAIKILNDEFNKDENAVKRFVNESEAVSMVDSPNIVKIYDVAMSENLKYIVMEFIDGITLKDYIDKIGALGWKEAVHYVRQILTGLSIAHEKGIIHRDIKPQNMMLLSDGQVKITDFGIAKTPTSEPLTMTDKAIGTVNYISPEQASGATVDEKSDIYSVGVMLYEMLTGVLPFTAESPVAVAMMQVSKEPEPPRKINSQIPVGLEQIVLKAMSKSPADRFVNAAAMEKALAYFAQNPTVVFSNSSSTVETIPGKKKKKTAEEKEQLRREAAYKHRSMTPIILGITLSFFTVAIISAIYLLHKNQGEGIGETVDNFIGIDGKYTEITVDGFEGEIFDDKFVDELKKQNINAVIDDESPKNHQQRYEDYEIISQDKKGKRRVDKDGFVTVFFKVNPPDDSVPVMKDVISYSEEAAISILIDEFPSLLTEADISIEYDYYDDVDKIVKGEVYDTIPKPDADISKNVEAAVGSGTNLRVVLFVSKGPTPIEVELPAVHGLKQDEAENAIKEAVKAVNEKIDVEFETETEESPNPDDTVIRVVHVVEEEPEEEGEDPIITETELSEGDKFMTEGRIRLVVSKYAASAEEPDDTLDEPDVSDNDQDSEQENFDDLLGLRGEG